MRNTRSAIVSIALLLLGMLGACQSEATRREWAAIDAAIASRQCSDPGATGMQIDVAEVGTGYGVLFVPDLPSGADLAYCYSVNEGEVFAVNALAAGCSPQLPKAAAPIADAVYEALDLR